MGRHWTGMPIAEKLALVKEAYGRSSGSALGIARAVSAEVLDGVSRNGIISFWSRHPELATTHPFTGTRPRTAKGRPPRVPPAPARVNKVKLTPREPVPEPPPPLLLDIAPKSLDLTLVELETGRCKHTGSEGPPFLFCGHPTRDGSSWCDYHRKKYLIPPTYKVRS